MTEYSLFDAMRITGASALEYSKDWFTRPMKTALRFTEELLAIATNGRINPADPAQQVMAQSLYCSGLLAGRWAMSGYPTVTMGHRTAAALMATKMRGQDAVDFVKIPWPAFAIRIPPGLLLIEEDGGLRDANVLFVTAMEREEIDADASSFGTEPGSRWWYKLYASSNTHRPAWMADAAAGFFDGITLWGFNTPLFHMAEQGNIDEIHGYERWDTRVPVEVDKRTEGLVRSLILGTCIHLSGDPRERSERALASGFEIKERKSKYRESDELPQYNLFELTSNIRVNLHHEIREYVEHGGNRKPTVQTLAAGHWKRVAYGPGHSQRRLQHILPYWRGDPNAPISVRVK